MNDDEKMELISNTKLTPSETLLIEGRSFPTGYSVDVLDRKSQESFAFFLVWATLDDGDEPWVPQDAVREFIFSVLFSDEVHSRIEERNCVLIWDCLNLDCDDIHTMTKKQMADAGWFDDDPEEIEED